MDQNSALIALSQSEQTDYGRIPFATQSDLQKVFSAIWELEDQVNNGGFTQYLRNADSDIIRYAPFALRAIGANSCKQIVEHALSVVAPLPDTAVARHVALDQLGEAGQQALAKLDEEFFAYPDDLTGLLFGFVCQHPEEFGNVPSTPD